ncbi:MAG: PAS domain S-box protein [Hydrogenophaga sp.]|uniref:PAS domain-containing hybrid sensor histidine kinase/response regulator n=1 Tax=Hydrogenophaga sp. TaxID=1904254 RepID=UPI001D724587|nr:PAS domain S-box protein [Hydrogenophaga sp.]MBX3608795.1 PAS domain S-box protein [Hydrogenophaga sp.]
MSAAHPAFSAQEIDTLDALADMVHGAVLVYDLDEHGQGALVYISDGCIDLWGLDAQTIMADEARIWLMAPQDQRRYLRNSFIGATRDGKAWAHEWRIHNAQGNTRWLRGTSKPADLHGGRRRWRVFISDVTDSVRARALELASEDRFRRIFDSIPSIAVQAYGTDMIVRYWNKGSEHLYGYCAQEAIGRSMLDLVVPPAQRGSFDRNFLQSMDGKTSLNSGVHWLQRKDGSPVEVSANEIITEHPERGIEIFCIDFDLSEHRRAEEQRMALEAQLRESQKLEALGTLAGGIAHDFNNILAAILGNARLAFEDARGQSEITESVSEILRAGTRAKELVQRILAFSRRQTLQRRVMPLRDVVDESVRLLRATIPRCVDLRVDIDPATPVVLADPTQLQQVLLNLCTNAWQAMGDRPDGLLRIELAPHHGPVPLLKTGAGIDSAEDDWPEASVRLSVADNGDGMKEATMARLFEPFFTTKAPGEGTGLGLAVVHGIVRDHQGAVRVASRPGEGTVFDVYLRAATSLLEDAQGEPRWTDSGGLSTAPVSTRILYVDDDALIADLMHRLLCRAGHEPLVFTSPTEALRAVREQHLDYELAILDHSMPGMSGLELARALRAIHPAREVAMTSGYISPDLRREAPGAGISELIDKPNTGDELLEAIDRLVRRVQAEKVRG